MPIFILVVHVITELFEQTDHWRQIYKETSSTFYTSNNVFLQNKVFKNQRASLQI